LLACDILVVVYTLYAVQDGDIDKEGLVFSDKTKTAVEGIRRRAFILCAAPLNYDDNPIVCFFRFAWCHKSYCYGEVSSRCCSPSPNSCDYSRPRASALGRKCFQ